MTTANVKKVNIVNGNIVMVESGGTTVTTTNTPANLTDAMTLMASTDADLDVRRQVHTCLRLIKYTGDRGNFGGN
jgi:hypothetical protein